MSRDEIPLLLGYIPLLIIDVIFAYFHYLRVVRRYRRILYRTLVKGGVPRRRAREFSRKISTLKLRELLRFANMRNIA